MSVESSGRLIRFSRHNAPLNIVAYGNGEAISAAQFAADIRVLAERLPACTHVMNCCADRYHFAVGFAAALSRGQVTLLPPNATPELTHRLRDNYPGLYRLADEVDSDVDLHQVPYPAEPALERDDFAIPSFDSEQIAAIIFTSGSTAEPVQHAKRWGILVQSAIRAGMRLGVSAFPGAAVLATVSPQHSYGLESSIMLPLQNGLVIAAARAFYPADVVHELSALPRPRILVTTPFHLRVLCADASPAPKADLVVSATAPLSSQAAASAEARFGCPLMEIYGSAEAGQTALRRTVQVAEWTCIDGITLSQDADGTWASGDLLERKTLLNDIVELSRPDTFVLQGRTADLVNIAGKRTSLSHLNFHLNAIDGVVDGAFVVREKSGESTTRLAAFVVAPSLTRQFLKQELRKRIDPVFLPRPLCFVAALPRNFNSKLTRTAIEELLHENSTRTLPHCTEIVFPADSAALKGHFPGDPIVPGAVLLQEVLCAFLQEVEGSERNCQLKSVKFLRPVKPDERLRICWTPTANGDTRFDCFVQEQTVATGIIANSVLAI